MRNGKQKQVSEISVSYHPMIKPSDRLSINCSGDVYHILRDHAFNPDTLEYKEYFKLILLNHSNKVLGIINLSEGGMDSTVVDVRLIFQTALLTHCSYIIIAHNHPAGGLYPSSYDDNITTKIKEAGKFLDIILYDHIIISTEGYYSYADVGKL